jgi:pimeloyl-ACP methyl ester carboxylesterase
VALHYTALHPERVASLTLVDARIRALQPTQRLSDWPDADVWERKLKELSAPALPNETEMGYRFLEVLAETRVLGENVESTAVGLLSPLGFSKNTRRTTDRWLQLLRTTTARNDFKAVAGLTLEKICQVNHPVLAMFGELSHCLPSCWGLKQHLSNCRVVIVPKAGHFHPMVRPTFFARRLRQFLNKATARDLTLNIR